MKRLKHFFGWLFRYCPYGDGCPPKHPFKGGKGGHAVAIGKGSIAIPGLHGNATEEEKKIHEEKVRQAVYEFRPGGSGAGWTPPEKITWGGGGC